MSKIKVRQGWIPLRPLSLSLVCRLLSSPCVITRSSFCVHVLVSYKNTSLTGLTTAHSNKLITSLQTVSPNAFTF